MPGFKFFEISSFRGRPVCLYEFTWGGQVWRYTSADRNVSYGVDGDGNPIGWTAISISDNGFTQGSDPEPFTITLPRNLDMVQLFNGTPPSTPISIIARRFHKDDTAEEATVYWSGTIGSVKGKDAVTAEVIGLSISQTTKRTGLRLGWEVNCPHALFDSSCRANKADFAHETTITAITGTAIEVADFKSTLTGDNYRGGFIEWDATGSGSIDRRPIDSYAGGTTLQLLGRADRLTVGQTITIFPGCNLSTETCNDTFNNLPNHGGFKFMTKKSPFDGNPVW